MPGKTCTKCSEAKPLEDFTTSKTSKDGRQPDCKVCRNAAERERYKYRMEDPANRERHRARVAQWNKANPERRLEITRTWRSNNPELARRYSTNASRRLRERDPDYHRRWYWANVEKERARLREDMRRWRAEHPEEERARKRRYRQNNAEAVKEREREKTYRRRAQIAASPETAAYMTRLLQEPCVYCGSTENMTIDHVVPLVRGGRQEPANLAPACKSCNSSKCALLLEEWHPSIRRTNVAFA